MALTHTVRQSVTDSTGTTIGATAQDQLTITGDTEQNLSIALTTGEVAVEHVCALPVDTLILKSLYIKATVDVPTLGFYSAAPALVGSTIALTANTPIVWTYGAGPCPLGATADIVTLKHTNNAIGTLEIRALFGPS